MDLDWINDFVLPEPGNMMKAGPKGPEIFAKQGLAIAKTIREHAERETGRDFGQLDVLDLACGVGRVALPLYKYTGQPGTCVDVDEKAVSYLKSQLPKADVRLVGTEPPLPFEDGRFDVIFSVSLWTHLRPEMAEAYLHEVKRLLKDDGVALITTAGFTAVPAHKGLVAWDPAMTPEILKERGAVFFANSSGLIGNAAHSPDYIQKTWTSIFPRIETIEACVGVNKIQDLNIMRK